MLCWGDYQLKDPIRYPIIRRSHSRKESQRKEIALKKEAIGLRAGNAKDRVRESGEGMLSTDLPLLDEIPKAPKKGYSKHRE